ncbi:uncharacterized protein LAESUDRAFT_723653 [Laetiporus sulphureus 93-53]|uniref:Galactose-binding like protein n=1 Tax=Laetiporus sulphureus 93-53 TaxID=1314785 RepID=A0A165FBW0_9APHY|nr:uncharacterized protein LAESUDRAFT_723653 [Laetiporus sulphureus 93-53]KZT08734.1 hypothetical protein LAESUDRAFT_723653 [Laetiporus sulphureus 93-53]
MQSELQQLITSETRVKVSSTLDKSVGKKFLTDGDPETCWTSQQGLPQFIQLSFPAPILPKRFAITFQGGFVGTRCTVEIPEETGPEKTIWQTLVQIYPEDVNRKQIFELPDLQRGVKAVKLVFHESSDFFGRITVYDLQLEGSNV